MKKYRPQIILTKEAINKTEKILQQMKAVSGNDKVFYFLLSTPKDSNNYVIVTDMTTDLRSTSVTNVFVLAKLPT